MKKLAITIVLLSIFCSGALAQSQWINFGRYEKENSEVKTTPKAVFFGDSITDIWVGMDSDFFKNNNFLGRGICGQVTSQMVLRYRKDVIAHHPKYVVILAGINDIAQNEGEIDIEDTFANVVTMIELAKVHKIKPVVCLLFPTSTIQWRPALGNPNPKIDAFNEMVINYGKANKVTVVEYFQNIDKSAGSLPKELSADSIHPNMDGYKIMEQEILKVLK